LIYRTSLGRSPVAASGLMSNACKATRSSNRAIRSSRFRRSRPRRSIGSAHDSPASNRGGETTSLVGATAPSSVVYRWVTDNCVRAVDVVGVVACGDVQLVIRPKIPIHHFVFLLERAGWLPRLDWTKTTLGIGESLWDLIAEWFVSSVEGIARVGLVRDYKRRADWLDAVRGSLVPSESALALYSGRLAFSCEFDEFTYDSSVNRILKTALRRVTRDARLSWPLRQRVMRLLGRFDEVGETQPGDLSCVPDPRHKHYRDGLLLAKHVLQQSGRVLAEGSELAWAFLVRTPPLIEAGLRAVLKEALPSLNIRKARLALGDSGLTVNPDLLIDEGLALADVKYKQCDGEWRRSDLY
jgi:5-methylcytosine-specific restriction endonuclease McrBC regulatory subunit McrC